MTSSTASTRSTPAAAPTIGPHGSGTTPSFARKKPTARPNRPPRSHDATFRTRRPLNQRLSPNPWMTKKNTGVRKTPNRVTPIMPLNTAVPSERRISDPAPVARTSGTTPRMKAKDVIVMGRSRSRDASTAASARDLPPRCNCWANSTTRMAFLHASPTRTTRPICTKMLTESFVAHTPASAQSRHIGTTRMTARGMVQLS